MRLPPYDTFPSCAGAALVLRQVLPADMEALPDITYYDGVHATSADQALGMPETIHRDDQQGNSVQWGIADLATGATMGTCG